MTRTNKKPLRGKPLMRAVMNQIIREPQHWDQKTLTSKSDCGTSHCFAGWALALHGVRDKKDQLTSVAANLLELDCYNAWQALFEFSLTIKQLRRFVVGHCGAKGIIPLPKNKTKEKP